MAAIDPRIPVTLLTGFLGSGKTTLLNHWVKDPLLNDCAILINEFGAVGLDHLLVEKVDERVVLLESGCICCTVQGSLIETLQQLYLKMCEGTIPPFRRVLIESTGLADPAPVIFSLQEEGFVVSRYRFDGCVTLVDATHGAQQLATHFEAVKQVALADYLILSKCDLASEEQLAELSELLQRLNPAAPIERSILGAVAPQLITKLGGYSQEAGRNPKQILNWLRSEPQQGFAAPLRPQLNAQPLRAGVTNQKANSAPHQHIVSFSLRFGAPLRPSALLRAIELIQQRFGASLLRFKGILQLEGESLPVVIHGVHGQLYPLQTLGDWPDGRAQSRLVFIVKREDADGIRTLFEEIIAAPEPSLAQMLQERFAQG